MGIWWQKWPKEQILWDLSFPPATMWWSSFCLPSRLLKSRKLDFICLSATEFLPRGVLFVLCAPSDRGKWQRGRLMPAMNCLCSVLSFRVTFPDSHIQLSTRQQGSWAPFLQRLSLPVLCTALALTRLCLHWGFTALPPPWQKESHLSQPSHWHIPACGTLLSWGNSATMGAQAGTCSHHLWYWGKTPWPMETLLAKQPLHL